MAAVDSLTALIMFSSRGAADVERLVDEAVVGDVAVTIGVAVVVTATAVTGDVVVVIVAVGSVAAGAVVRAAKASENPAQVGLLSGLVEH